MVKTLKGSYFRPQISVIDAEQIDKSAGKNNIIELV